MAWAVRIPGASRTGHGRERSFARSDDTFRHREEGPMFVFPNQHSVSLMLIITAVAMGAIVQFRMMGGAIGLAVATCIFNGYTKSILSSALSPAQLRSVLQTAQAIETLPPALQTIVKNVFARAFAVQFRIIIGTSAAQFLGIALMWQKKFLRVA
jgi:hypothetical protein